MLKIADWPSFQSYKDRNPPWIRFHKKFLDDYKFQKMSADSRALLPMLWLLASEDEDPVSGMLRIGYEEISFRLRLDIIKVKNSIKECIQEGFIIFIEDEEKTLFSHAETTSYKSVTPELRKSYSETETETETDNKRVTGRKKNKNRFEEFWNEYPRQRRGNKNRTQKAYNRALEENRATEDQIIHGCRVYAKSAEVAAGYAKGVEAWLNDDRWTTDYTTKPKQNGAKNNGKFTAKDAQKNALEKLGFGAESFANNGDDQAVLCDSEHLREDRRRLGNFNDCDG